jgi:hypothetical protein
MVASLWGSVGTGIKEDKSSNWCIWAAGFHHVTACSHLVRVLNNMNHFFSLIFQIYSGHGKLRINETVNTGVHLYFMNYFQAYLLYQYCTKITHLVSQ